MFGLIDSYGKWAMMILLGVEEAGVPLPIPGDLLLMYAGSHISYGSMGWISTITYSVIGTVLGSSFLYGVFRLGGQPFVHKYGKYLLLPPDRVRQLENWLTTRGRTAIIVGRFIPGLRVFLSGIAGLLGLSYWYFLPQIIIASFIWVLLFTGAGFLLGERWSGFADSAQKYGFIFLIIFVAGIAHYAWKEYHRTRKLHLRQTVKQKQQSQTD